MTSIPESLRGLHSNISTTCTYTYLAPKQDIFKISLASSPTNLYFSITNGLFIIHTYLKNFFGDGVFTADGQAWKAKRTAVMHCLVKGTASSTSEMSQRLEREANRAADIFCCQIQLLKGQQNRPISGHCSDYGGYVVSTNIVPLLQRATIGLIYRYITHTDPEWLLPTKIRDAETNDDKSNEPMKVIGKYESVSNVTSSSEATRRSRSLLDSYLSSIIRIRMIILAQSRSVWFLLPRWCYTLFSSLYRDEESTLGPIREFAKRACKDARPGSPLERLRDLGSLYISNTCPPTKRSQMISFYHTNITNKNLLDEAITLLFAGQDTSAATLSWTLHLLSLHPKAQERVFKEVRDVLKIINQEFPSRSKDRKIFITRKEIKQLSFLDAVIKESMRLYPVAPFVVRHLVEKVNIPAENNDGIISLPKGSQACLWIYGLHRNPKLWNNPDDFIPERWLDINLKDPGQTNGGYMPFAFGARNCLGQPLARVILRTILAKLVLQYKFKDVRLRNEENSIDLRKEMQAGFTVLPTGGVTLEIYSRIKENQEY